MLILERKVHQDILIGDDIVITIVEINGNKAKVGITAPDNIKILRPEAKKKYRDLPDNIEIDVK